MTLICFGQNLRCQMWIFSLVFPSPVVPAFFLLPSTFKLATEREGRRRKKKKKKSLLFILKFGLKGISKSRVSSVPGFPDPVFPLLFPFPLSVAGISVFSFAGVRLLLLLRCSPPFLPFFFPLSSAAAAAANLLSMWVFFFLPPPNLFSLFFCAVRILLFCWPKWFSV